MCVSHYLTENYDLLSGYENYLELKFKDLIKLKSKNEKKEK